MKNYSKLVYLGSILIANSLIAADTIVLKTGEKYVGKVISENATSYLVEIHVTKTIKDEKTFLKDNVSEIIKESALDKDLKDLGKLVPTPDKLDHSAYAALIQKAEIFTSKYPKAKETKKVNADLAILKREQTVIAAGGIKLNGKLISASTIKENAYDIDAQIIQAAIKDLAQRGHYQPALRKWEELESDFPYSTAYLDSLPLVANIVQKYQIQLDKNLSTLKARTEQRDRIIKSLESGDRSRAEQDLAQKMTVHKDRIEKEKKELKTKWLTTDSFDKSALEHNLRSAKSVIQSINRLDTSKIKLAGPVYLSAWNAISNDQLEQAGKLISQLKKFKMAEKYISPLMVELTKKQEMKTTAMEKAAAEKAEQERLAKEAAEKKAQEEAEMEKKPKKKGKK